MHLIDVAGAIAGHRHTRSPLVTAAVDGLQFLHPIKVGDLIILQSARDGGLDHVARSGSGGLFGRDADRPPAHDESRLSHVRGVDRDSHRLPIPRLIVESDDERRREAEAQARRAERLRARHALELRLGPIPHQ